MESYHPARPASLPAHDPRHQHQHPFHTLVPETPNRPSSPYSIVTDFAGKNVRRPSSTLPYTQSGIKDRRRSVAKGPKWLVMVFPPTLLHQQESSASSSKHVQNGPSGRFLSGVLMPLYSTHFAQLTAVSREFGLPSTVGVCMYLQLTEGSSTFTPRLSDDSWQILWSPYLSPSEDTPPGSPTQAFPIAGRIEFDIDQFKAKWYQGWINGTLSRPSIADSSLDLSATDGEKPKASDEQDHGASESSVGAVGLETKAGPPSAVSGSTTQAPPRRLSLLDRRDRDLPHINAPSAIPPRLAHYALESGSTSTRYAHDEDGRRPPAAKQALHHLSPIAQVDSPPSSHPQKDLTALVTSWQKSSASISPAVMATSPAQPNTPPARTDTTLSHDTTAADETVSSLDLADFAWSISSRGPASPTPSSKHTPLSSKYARSMHLMERTYGSVILTPSTQTSWGPASLLESPVSNASRYPSPDVAARMIEDSPATPSTATTWGPKSLLYSPVSNVSRLPSPDMAARMIEDAPKTPSTATTWGPPSSYPPTPAHYDLDGDFYRLPSPDVGERTMDPDDEAEGRMGWPYYEAEEPVPMGWPYYESNSEESVTAPATPRMGWPYVSFNTSAPATALVSRMGWPYNTASAVQDKSLPTSLPRADAAYPHFDLYPAAYPHLEIYPPSTRSVVPTRPAPVSVTLPRVAPAYPVFDLYPAGYPFIEIYPAVQTTVPAPKPQSLPVALPRPSACYPTFDLYPAGYPFLEIYPAVSQIAKASRPQSLPVTLPRPTAGYPDFNLYPAGYPHLEIYPAVASATKQRVTPAKAVRVTLPRPAASYPDFDLYPAGYPHLEIYPVVSKPIARKPRALPVTLPSFAVIYPIFNIYPPTYPSLVIYPDIALPKLASVKDKELSVRLPRTAGYPTFDLYPAGYPVLTIYPPVFVAVPAKAKASLPTVPSSRVLYPAFDIYPAVYPWVTPYPSCLLEPLRPQLAPPAEVRRRPTKTHKMLHDEWFAKQQKQKEHLPLPPLPKPEIPLPPTPPVPVTSVRTRARSGTMSRPPPRAPQPPIPSPAPREVPVVPATPSPRASPTTPVSKSREELHALIFGSSDDSPMSPPSVVSAVPSSGLLGPELSSAFVVSPISFVESPEDGIPQFVSPIMSPPVRPMGLPASPSVTVGPRGGMRRSVSAQVLSSKYASPIVARPPKNLDVVAETDDVPPPSPRSPLLQRSGSLGRLRTNDDLFKKRQSLHNPPRPRTTQNTTMSVLSEFPSPPGSARASLVGSPGRPVSKLDTSRYPFR